MVLIFIIRITWTEIGGTLNTESEFSLNPFYYFTAAKYSINKNYYFLTLALVFNNPWQMQTYLVVVV